MRSLFTEHFILSLPSSYLSLVSVTNRKSLRSREAQPASTSCSSDEQWLWTNLYALGVRMRLARLDVSQAFHGQNQVQGTQAQSETSLPMVPRAATMQHRVTLGKQPTSTLEPTACKGGVVTENTTQNHFTLMVTSFAEEMLRSSCDLWMFSCAKTKHPHPVRPGQDPRPNYLM